MTLKNLIDELEALKDQGIDLNTEVRLGSDYGDHCHTQQALQIRSIALRRLRESAYSDSGQAVATDDDHEAPDASKVVLLSALRVR